MRGQGTHVKYSEVSWSTLSKLVPYLLAYKLRFSIAMGFLLAAKMASLYLPFVLKHIVDGLDGQSATVVEGLSTSSISTINIIAVPLGLLLAYGVVRLSNVLFSELRDTVFGRVTEHAMHSIALTVFKHLHQLDLSFHLNRKTGGLARDIERGTNGISFLLRFMVFNIVPTLIEIIFVIVILSSKYSLWFGAIVLGAIICYVAWSVWATEIRTKYVRQMNTADSDTNTRAIDSLINYETVKYFNNETYEATLYDKNLDNWEAARRKNRLSIFSLNGGQAIVISIFMTAAMILAAYHVQDGRMSLGDFVLINAFMMQIFMPLNFLGFVYREMKGSLANIERLFNLLEEKPSIQDSIDSRDVSSLDHTIDFKDVNFYYDEKRSIFSNLTFSIEAHTKVAIVGSSGSGKSTISKLLFRFYDVNAGAITIGGENIRDIRLNSLRSRMGFVPQDTVLFNTSIVENIRYGNLHATDDEVNTAIDLAHLRDFITRLPDGWNTVVGERGLKLSGGEKQRVAIARTILKDPDILVFDEATSSLDSESEKEILSAFKNLGSNKTCLIIAHRLSTISDADKIIVLEDGDISEEGKHNDLLKKNGRYAELWRLQEVDGQ